MYHAQFEQLGHTRCFGGAIDQDEQLTKRMGISQLNRFGFTVHYVRVESAEWNLGRISQHWCDICPR